MGKDGYTTIPAGTKVGNYIVEEMIGAGSMAVVFRGRHKETGQEAAIKVFPHRLLENQAYIVHFHNESRTLALFDHPNIVKHYEHGQWEGTGYYAMEYVGGPSLREEIAKGMCSRQIVRVARHVCAALDCMHSMGYVHRDIKTGNILISADGEAKLSDFGLARSMREGAERGQPRLGAFKRIGSRGYMAPEQLMDPGCADARSDLYSLGLVLYEMLVGKKPEDLNPPPPGGICPSADPRFDRIVAKLLQSNRDKRYQSALLAHDDLQILEASLEPLELCPKCGAEVPTMIARCRRCEKDLSGFFGKCESCGAAVRKSAKDCARCGKSLRK